MKTHNLDATNQIVGRFATKIANLLMGKGLPTYVPYLNRGDEVVISNADKIKFTGKKMTQKLYTRYSGYPGGLSKTTPAELKIKNPKEIIRHAVYGMLPNNKLRDQQIKKLKLRLLAMGRFAGVYINCP